MLAGSSETRLNRVYGFAARCEAVASPRRLAQVTFGLRPWFGLSPRISCNSIERRVPILHSAIFQPTSRRSKPHMAGAKPEPGAKPKCFLQLTGGAEPRLTSGGKAAASVEPYSKEWTSHLAAITISAVARSLEKALSLSCPASPLFVLTMTSSIPLYAFRSFD
jgi:hypothetical protein